MRQRGDGDLSSKCIVVPESREVERFSKMLEKYGASVVRCPLVLVRPLEDTQALDDWIVRLGAGCHDTLVFYTGEGVTHISARAEAIGRKPETLDALAAARKICRGNKPGAALRRLGLKADFVTELHTTDGLLSKLETLSLAGSCVGLQLYPGAPADRLTEAIDRLGAKIDPVLPYRYASDQDDEQVAPVILAMASGQVDLIAFTSKLQVQRLQQVAARTEMQSELRQAFKSTAVAAVGPVVAAAIEQAGWHVDIQPTSSFHLKPLVSEILRVLA